MPYLYDFKEETEAPTQALCIRRTTTLTNVEAVITEMVGEVGEYLREQGIEPAGPPIACYHSIDPERMDVEAGYPISGEPHPRWQIRPVSLPGGVAVTMVHTGATPEPITYAAEAMTGWLERAGYEPSGPLVEMYLTDPLRSQGTQRRRTKLIQRFELKQAAR